jgi:hypothetical protein
MPVEKPINPEWDRFARDVMTAAKNWTYEQYKERYPQIDPAFFDGLKASDDPLDGRSAMVVIARDGDLNQIVGSLRVVLPSREKPLMPMEQQFDVRVPRPSKTAKTVNLILSDAEIVERVSEGGQVAELKSLVLHRRPGKDLGPMLHHFALEHRLLDWDWIVGAGWPENSAMEHNVSKLHLVCDASMLEYYGAYGFEPIPGLAPVSGNHFLQVDQKTFFEKSRELMSQRRGFRLTPKKYNGVYVPGYKDYDGVQIRYDVEVEMYDLPRQIIREAFGLEFQEEGNSGCIRAILAQLHAKHVAAGTF